MEFLLKAVEFVLALIFSLFGVSGGNTVADRYAIPDNVAACELRVHFIDVGQGDCIFAELPDGKSMLIDAGTNDNEDAVCDYIRYCGEDYLDFVVATHPHSDHIGGMDGVIDKFDIGTFYMPDVEYDTKTFESMIDSLQQSKARVMAAEADAVIYQDADLKIQILAPADVDAYDDVNNYSAVVKLTYGETEFLFMGDAQHEVERDIQSDVSADVLKVGHHGSETSTGKEFLKRVAPDYAVISCGVDNEYGHPHKSVVDRLNGRGTKVFRTDTMGTVVIGSDSVNIEY